MAQIFIKNSDGKVLLKSFKDCNENVKFIQEQLYEKLKSSESFSFQLGMQKGIVILSDTFLRNNMIIFEY